MNPKYEQSVPVNRGDDGVEAAVAEACWQHEHRFRGSLRHIPHHGTNENRHEMAVRNVAPPMQSSGVAEAQRE